MGGSSRFRCFHKFLNELDKQISLHEVCYPVSFPVLTAGEQVNAQMMYLSRLFIGLERQRKVHASFVCRIDLSTAFAQDKAPKLSPKYHFNKRAKWGLIGGVTAWVLRGLCPFPPCLGSSLDFLIKSETHERYIFYTICPLHLFLPYPLRLEAASIVHERLVGETT